MVSVICSFVLFFYLILFIYFSPGNSSLHVTSCQKKMAESEEEVDVLVQRVVKDISNAFKRNPNM